MHTHSSSCLGGNKDGKAAPSDAAGVAGACGVHFLAWLSVKAGTEERKC